MIDQLHGLNILIHMVAGLGALLLGLWLMVRRKGDRSHRRWGKVFQAVGGVVVVTAALGALVFRPDVALVSVTLLVGYMMESGWRALKLRGARPALPDILLAVVALVVGAWLIVATVKGAAMVWKPAVVRPIAGGLIFWGLYDLSRSVLPRLWFARIWKLEHGAKLVNAIGGLASAAVGTVGADFRPWSQIGPSAVFIAWLLTYLALYGRKHIAPLA